MGLRHGRAISPVDMGGHRFLTFVGVALDRRSLGTTLVGQIEIATLFWIAVDVKFDFSMSQ